MLVLRFGAFGDVLRTLPAVGRLRSGWSEARIVWAVDGTWAGFLADHADLDEVVPFPRKSWEEARRRGRVVALGRAWRAWRERLVALEARLALDFHGNLRSGVSGRLSGAEVRLGYEGHQQKELNRRFTTHRVEAGERRRSRIERNLDLIAALGLPRSPLPSAGLRLGDAAREQARTIAGEGPYAIVAPGVSRSQAYKRPPATLLAAGARAAARLGIRPWVVYGPGEEEQAREVVAASEGEASFAPPTDLATLAALTAGARLFLGGDTGPMHLACAFGCPVVAVYGPTDPVVNAPWGVDHRVVHPDVAYTGIKKEDRRIGSFDGLTAERVTEAVDELARAC